MPTYTTSCQGCQKTNQVRLSFADYDAVKLGTKLLSCGECEGSVSLVFDPGNVNFVLRDGESGGWTSKAMRENKYRAGRQREMERRQKDHAPKTRLLPNFAGQQTESWAEARALAFDTAAKEVRAETGDNSMALRAAKEAASTYDPLVKKEGLCA